MSPEQRQWILSTANQALAAQHVWSAMAACEAALESSYGQSWLAGANNLFGTKIHRDGAGNYTSINLPTKEFINGVWVEIQAAFMAYPTVMACFADRMATLQRLRTAYPHYDAALRATDPFTYVTEVSKSWSTDPNRAATCIAIYKEVFGSPQAINLDAGDN